MGPTARLGGSAIVGLAVVIGGHGCALIVGSVDGDRVLDGGADDVRGHADSPVSKHDASRDSSSPPPIRDAQVDVRADATDEAATDAGGGSCAWTALLGVGSPQGLVGFFQIESSQITLASPTWTPRAINQTRSPTTTVISSPLIVWHDDAGFASVIGTGTLGATSTTPAVNEAGLGSMSEWAVILPSSGDASYAPTKNEQSFWSSKGAGYNALSIAPYPGGLALAYPGLGNFGQNIVSTFGDAGWSTGSEAFGVLEGTTRLPASLAATATGLIAATAEFVTGDSGAMAVYTEVPLAGVASNSWSRDLAIDASVSPAGPPRIIALRGGVHDLLIVYAQAGSNQLVSIAHSPEGTWSPPIDVGGSSGLTGLDVPALAASGTDGGAILVTRNAMGQAVSSGYRDGNSPSWTTPLAFGPRSLLGPAAVASGACGGPIAAYPASDGAHVWSLTAGAWMQVGGDPVPMTQGSQFVGVGRND
jgi:hypothetical protein